MPTALLHTRHLLELQRRRSTHRPWSCLRPGVPLLLADRPRRGNSILSPPSAFTPKTHGPLPPAKTNRLHPGLPIDRPLNQTSVPGNQPPSHDAVSSEGTYKVEMTVIRIQTQIHLVRIPGPPFP
jgi:hypothetical protein